MNNLGDLCVLWYSLRNMNVNSFVTSRKFFHGDEFNEMLDSFLEGLDPCCSFQLASLRDSICVTFVDETSRIFLSNQCCSGRSAKISYKLRLLCWCYMQSYGTCRATSMSYSALFNACSEKEVYFWASCCSSFDLNPLHGLCCTNEVVV